MTDHDPDQNVNVSFPTQSDISDVERMMGEIPPVQLLLDQQIYGVSFHRVEEDGSWTRIGPKAVLLSSPIKFGRES